VTGGQTSIHADIAFEAEVFSGMTECGGYLNKHEAEIFVFAVMCE
jgi:hypothetical protein